ncbi:MAG: hypothetical protein M9949_01680 [Candidatus Kapabacteria bacterium]|nr:hypothetical protein [Candidatus Kapabacteria bacterium]
MNIKDKEQLDLNNYFFDIKAGNISDFEDQPQYQNLTISPNGDFILSDYYKIEKVTTSIKHKEPIDSPIQMDTIVFMKWDNLKLEFICHEFLNWDSQLKMTYDSETNRIEFKSIHKQALD